jgi:hypothetical protein
MLKTFSISALLFLAFGVLLASRASLPVPLPFG